MTALDVVEALVMALVDVVALDMALVDVVALDIALVDVVALDMAPSLCTAASRSQQSVDRLCRVSGVSRRGKGERARAATGARDAERARQPVTSQLARGPSETPEPSKE